MKTFIFLYYYSLEYFGSVSSQSIKCPLPSITPTAGAIVGYSRPVFKLTNPHSAWSKFMIDHAVWVTNAQNNAAILPNQPQTAYICFNAILDANYTMFLAADNFCTWSIDGVPRLQATGFGTADTKTSIVFLKKGNHLMLFETTNYDDCQQWSCNPGGWAATINVTNKVIWDNNNLVLTNLPTKTPTTLKPSHRPTKKPTRTPTTLKPSHHPTNKPTIFPSQSPSQPSCFPTMQPTIQPSMQPTCIPSNQPSVEPTPQPTSQPSRQPSSKPSIQPSSQPVFEPSAQPLTLPSNQPSTQPLMQPSMQPTTQPTNQPSNQPSAQPSTQPLIKPSIQPTNQPFTHPLLQPTTQPSNQPLTQPSNQPIYQPSNRPSTQPFTNPSVKPSIQPIGLPTGLPTQQPTFYPSNIPSVHPGAIPSTLPSHLPSKSPFSRPSHQLILKPSFSTNNKQITSTPRDSISTILLILLVLLGLLAMCCAIGAFWWHRKRKEKVKPSGEDNNIFVPEIAKIDCEIVPSNACHTVSPPLVLTGEQKLDICIKVHEESNIKNAEMYFEEIPKNNLLCEDKNVVSVVNSINIVQKLTVQRIEEISLYSPVDQVTLSKMDTSLTQSLTEYINDNKFNYKTIEANEDITQQYFHNVPSFKIIKDDISSHDNDKELIGNQRRHISSLDIINVINNKGFSRQNSVEIDYLPVIRDNGISNNPGNQISEGINRIKSVDILSALDNSLIFKKTRSEDGIMMTNLFRSKKVGRLYVSDDIEEDVDNESSLYSLTNLKDSFEEDNKGVNILGQISIDSQKLQNISESNAYVANNSKELELEVNLKVNPSNSSKMPNTLDHSIIKQTQSEDLIHLKKLKEKTHPDRLHRSEDIDLEEEIDLKKMLKANKKSNKGVTIKLKRPQYKEKEKS